MGMHYEKRSSRIKRKRSIGFRARMKTKAGRKLLNRKRRAGRSLNVADKKRGY
jgi:large subunit ribosomal protein L34